MELTLLLGPVCPLFLSSACQLRSITRQKHNIPGDSIEDCLYRLIFHPCVLSQIAREIAVAQGGVGGARAAAGGGRSGGGGGGGGRGGGGGGWFPSFGGGHSAYGGTA